MFAKVFEQIFDSSISEDYQVRLVFEDFLTLADINGVVDKTPEAIARRTNVPLEIVKKAITILEAPDPNSRRIEEQGRRIARLDEHRDWGWFVVNYEYYRNLASEEQRREVTAARVRKYRQKAKCNAPVTHVTKCNAFPSSSPSALLRFNKVWEEWKKHRTEIRHTLTPSTEKRQLTKLMGWGIEGAIASISQSIEQGWQGLFKPERNIPQPKPLTVQEQEAQEDERIKEHNARKQAVAKPV